MPMPVKSLPVVQNWDCSGCALCCRSYRVGVTDAERERIENQGWAARPGFEGVPLFVREKGGDHRLNHRADGACVFLGADNRCRIHGEFGSAAKPFACRVYPFMLVPAGDHWRIGLRFACPTAAADTGRPLAEHTGEVREYAGLLEAGEGKRAVDGPPPPLQKGQVVPWGDVVRVANAASLTLADTADTLERRWRRVLALVAVGRASSFDGGGDPAKAVTGPRLVEFLYLLRTALADDTPATSDVPPPTWVGRSVFRPVLALYCRKDHGPDRGPAQTSAAGRVAAATRFALGKGTVPRVHAAIPPGARFAHGETPTGGLSAEVEALLTRLYRVKVESLQFCGPTNFGLPVWDGLESLALTFPAVCWLARVLAAGGRSPLDAATTAVRIVDDNFGFNPLLGSARQRVALRLLSGRGELAKLVAWYGR